jgi:hypothetical protein
VDIGEPYGLAQLPTNPLANPAHAGEAGTKEGVLARASKKAGGLGGAAGIVFQDHTKITKEAKSPKALARKRSGPS